MADMPAQGEQPFAYQNGQQYYHHEPNGPSGGAVGPQVAAQRYAMLRLHQAVKAGLVPASVLNAHPNTYPAIWRMVSQHISEPAAAAGFKDPGYWLRMGGARPMGPPGIGDQQVQDFQPQLQPGAIQAASGGLGGGPQYEGGGLDPGFGNVPPGMLQQFIAMLRSQQRQAQGIRY